MSSLHRIMAEVRLKYENWQKQNPYDHPAKLHGLMASDVVAIVKARGLKEVSLHETVYAGGVPEYAKAVASLREAEIKVSKE